MPADSGKVIEGGSYLCSGNFYAFFRGTMGLSTQLDESWPPRPGRGSRTRCARGVHFCVRPYYGASILNEAPPTDAARHPAHRHDRRGPLPRLRFRRHRPAHPRLAAGRLSARRRALGPFTPGFVADQSLASELAEIGVILLMFGVGLHFSLKDLWSVRAIAVPGAIVQIAVATMFGVGLGIGSAGRIGAGITFGLALSVASTVVLLRALQERRIINTERGRIAVGWLIVEDLVMVLTLVLLPALVPLLTAACRMPPAPASRLRRSPPRWR